MLISKVLQTLSQNFCLMSNKQIQTDPKKQYGV